MHFWIDIESACHDKNAIRDSMIQENKNKKIVWWCGALFHIIILTWDLIYPFHNFKLKNYLMQHVTIQNDWKIVHWKCFDQLIFLDQFHTSCILVNFFIFHKKFGSKKNTTFFLVLIAQIYVFEELWNPWILNVFISINI